MSAKIFLTSFDNVPGPEFLRVDLSDYFDADLDKEATKSIHFRLRERVRNCIRNDNFKLHWKDTDGDWILCETDDDFLEMALVMTDEDGKTWPTIHFKAEPSPETRPASGTPNSQGWVSIANPPAVDEPDSDTQESHGIAENEDSTKAVTKEDNVIAITHEITKTEKPTGVSIEENTTVVTEAGFSGSQPMGKPQETADAASRLNIAKSVVTLGESNKKITTVPEQEFPFADAPLVSVSEEFQDVVHHVKSSSCHVT